ncbi:MAG: 3-oxoacyl-ACP synthase, partial [Deltaproteobacteria bacterium]
MRARIAGTGAYLPERVMTNAEVCAGAPGCSADWIVEKLGIHERRIAAPDEQTSDMAVAAAKKAIAMAGIEAEELDGIICSVGTGDVPVPATGCYIQEKLGIAHTKGFAFDIKMACAGAVGGTMLARGLIESGIAK